MTTTIKAIANLLEQKNINYMFNREKSFLFLGIALENIKEQGIVIKVIENGNILQFSAPLLFQIGDRVHRGLVMQKILEMQFKTPLLKFICSTVDTNKQYIEARMDFPLYDDPLRSEDLFSCMNFMGAKLTEQLPRLKHILDFGCEPLQNP